MSTRKLPHRDILAHDAARMTAKQAAQKYKCSVSTLYQLGSDMGFSWLPATRRMPTSDQIRFIVLDDPTLTSFDLQQRYGVTAAAVSSACKAAGVTLARKPYARRVQS